MTSTIITATLAAFILAPGTLASAPTAKPTASPAVKLSPKVLSQVKGAQPKFKPLLSKPALIQGAKAKKIVPVDHEPPLTTLATLSATNTREGEYAVDFKCAFVYASSGADGFARFPHRLIEYCKTQEDWHHAGAEVVFPAEAGRAYAVECNSEASPNWKIRHKIGTAAWSPVATVDTYNPVDYVIATSAGQVRVQFELDPTDNHVLQQGIRFCRVSRIG